MEKMEVQCFRGQTVVHIVKEGEERWECHDMKREIDVLPTMVIGTFAFIFFVVVIEMLRKWEKS